MGFLAKERERRREDDRGEGRGEKRRHSGSRELLAVSAEIITNYDILRFIYDAIYDSRLHSLSLSLSSLALSLSLKQKNFFAQEATARC